MASIHKFCVNQVKILIHTYKGSIKDMVEHMVHAYFREGTNIKFQQQQKKDGSHNYL